VTADAVHEGLIGGDELQHPGLADQLLLLSGDFLRVETTVGDRGACEDVLDFAEGEAGGCASDRVQLSLLEILGQLALDGLGDFANLILAGQVPVHDVDRLLKLDGDSLHRSRDDEGHVAATSQLGQLSELPGDGRLVDVRVKVLEDEQVSSILVLALLGDGFENGHRVLGLVSVGLGGETAGDGPRVDFHLPIDGHVVKGCEDAGFLVGDHVDDGVPGLNQSLKCCLVVHVSSTNDPGLSFRISFPRPTPRLTP